MKNIDNYIQEKLYIGKGFNGSIHEISKEEFKECLSDLGLYVDRELVSVKNNVAFPRVNLYYYFSDCFYIKGRENMRDDCFAVLLGEQTGFHANDIYKYNTCKYADYNFDFKSNYKNILLYTKKNAEILAKILDEASK